jgi:hypothetical protein
VLFHEVVTASPLARHDAAFELKTSRLQGVASVSRLAQGPMAFAGMARRAHAAREKIYPLQHPQSVVAIDAQTNMKDAS